MKTLSFGEKGEFDCYRTDEIEAAKAAKAAKSQGDNVMLARECGSCGDLLFGESLDPNLQVECEEGFHGSRRGVWI
jgi:hypothetical protein